MGKDRGGDVGVTNDVLRRADQVGLVETADINEVVIAIRDDASCIRCRDEFLLRSKGNLALRNRLVVSHLYCSYALS
ncbi:hypothetical protein D3C81_2165050 [compost metagenome]